MYKHSLLSMLLILNSSVFYSASNEDNSAGNLDGALNELPEALKNAVAEGIKKFKERAVDSENSAGPDLADPFGDRPKLNGDESVGFVAEVAALTDAAKATGTGAVNTAGEFLKSLPRIDEAKNNKGDIGVQNPILMQSQPWYQQAWNAEIAGYKGAGKYIIVGSAVVVTAVLAAYYLGYFDKKVTVEKMVDTLIEQAQTDSNIIIAELPKILALCKNKQMKRAVLQKVLANVVITPEIKKAFSC